MFLLNMFKLILKSFLICRPPDVSVKLAAKDSWTEAGGNMLLHMLYQSIWCHVLIDLNLYHCNYVNLTNTVV